jgi:hypothetical protein
MRHPITLIFRVVPPDGDLAGLLVRHTAPSFAACQAFVEAQFPEAHVSRVPRAHLSADEAATVRPLQ